MKSLVWILLGAVVSFQVIAITQEWKLFSAAWFGHRPVAAASVTEAQRQGAEQALREFHALSRHLYATGADPRFADRLPAAPPVVQELMADIAYLQHSGMSQEPKLVRLEVVTVRPFGASSLVLDTHEYWVVQLFTAPGHVPVGPPRSEVSWATYRLDFDAGRWRVGAWDLGEPVGEPAVRDAGR